jgi:hypothetical protein
LTPVSRETYVANNRVQIWTSRSILEVPMAARTDATRRWGVRAALAAAPIALSAVAFAAPASADESAFVDEITTRYAFVGAAEVKSMGREVCSMVRSGQPTSEAVEAMGHSAGMSPADALVVVQSATLNLGC